jgi:hypothetical protein
MSIVIIRGDKATGKTLIANALRNNQIANKRGALLVDEDQPGEIKPLLEKLLVGVPLPTPPADADDGARARWREDFDINALPWKAEPMVILVGGKEAVLDQFEEAAPGFKKLMGEVYVIDASKPGAAGDGQS